MGKRNGLFHARRPPAGGALASIVLAALYLAGCGGRGVAVPQASVETREPALSTQQEAVEAFMAQIDTVWIRGRVTIEDGADIPPGAFVAAESSIGFQHRHTGQAWEPDESLTWIARDTTSVRRDGRYELRIPAVLDSQSFDPILVRDPETGDRFYLLPSPSEGVVLSGQAGRAFAEQQYVFGVKMENQRDFRYKYARERALVIVDECAFRAEPAPDAPLLRSMEFGALVEILWREEEWARAVHRGQYGWVRLADLGDAEAFQRERERRGETGG